MADLDPDYFARTGSYTQKYFRDVYPAIDPRSPGLSQKGKVIIVTGASSGVGALGYAPAFAEAGAKAVVLVGRRADKLKNVADGLKKEYPTVDFLEVATSVTDQEGVKKLFDTVKTKYGRADVLVNNAGVASGQGTIVDVDPEAWWENFEINLKGTYLVTRGFLAALGNNAGTVISVTSAAATGVMPALSGYGISKMTLNRLTEFVAAEHPNVASVALDPGTINTEMVPGEYLKFALDTPMLAGASAVWLASEQAKFMTGRSFKVNWDVEELVKRREEIEKGEMGKFVLGGKSVYSE